MKRAEHLLAAICLISLVVAWILGFRSKDNGIEQFITAEQTRQEIHQIEEKICIAESGDYFVLGEGDGYGGVVMLMVQFDSAGVVTQVYPLEHKETIAFFQKVESNGLLNHFKGYDSQKKLPLIQEIDVISGASLTCKAIANGVQDAANILAENQWNVEPVEIAQERLKIGLAEITLIVFFLLSIIIHESGFKHRRYIRLTVQVLSVLVLGFITTTLMSIVHINSFLMLYFPKITVNLVWYLLLFIVFVPLVIRRKNYYCGTICPFGATQEFLGKLGKAKKRLSQKHRKYLIWLPRIMAWIVILVALLQNNPGIQNYEIFVTFFQLSGSLYLFGILAVVLVLSMFIQKPWCNYLCPIRGTSDYVEYWLDLAKLKKEKLEASKE